MYIVDTCVYVHIFVFVETRAFICGRGSSRCQRGFSLGLGADVASEHYYNTPCALVRPWAPPGYLFELLQPLLQHLLWNVLGWLDTLLQRSDTTGTHAYHFPGKRGQQPEDKLPKLAQNGLPQGASPL